MSDVLTQLQSRYQNLAQLSFAETDSGLVMVTINNDFASAAVCLHGAHVCAFQPRGQQPLLWLSKDVEFKPGKAIRGGVPVCWPWFGPHPTNSDLPQHGFARNQVWQLSDAMQLVDGATELLLTLNDTEASRQVWPHAFELALKITVAKQLTMELMSTNTGDRAMTVGGALHSYFEVASIAQTRVRGLDQVSYDDKVADQQGIIQRGDIIVDEEVDRVYLDTLATCLIQDEGNQRVIAVAKEGSRTTVVWNPWIDKAAAMVDFNDEGYQTMVCIEAVNAGDDCHTLLPGQSHCLTQTIYLVD
ncbi:D-hexose-6-phosphate mutarotase [Neiella sp. HB171785]|uniref:Putative glucose-6-phosphate 1-epimerase n=1 Tax=Neiella litorisoli TaxID=2771431 RepID=A0A8J6UEP8_9GAMM|nr:D-hexose-6-phosphate mutarotase [Neiella litorisoli]MBD1387976.1 D-hexose-6-phosphate mutarotase [Neiella litorisoli]